MGKRNPLGDVTDYWCRTEFQFKGSPHEHCLVAVAKDGILPEDVCSVDEARTDIVKDVVKRTVTCSLKIVGSIDEMMTNSTEEIEKDGYGDTEQRHDIHKFEWHPPKTLFEDKSDPRRLPIFPKDMNFDVDEDGNFADERTARRYLRWQLANQVHHCSKTCFKYCRVFPLECRFCFPCARKPEDRNKVIIKKEVDKRHRVRVKVLPPRNNAHLNVCPVQPLLPIAHGGNLDIQFIDCVHGAAEYTAMYSSKQEAPDLHQLDCLFAKKLANMSLRKHDLTYRDHLRAVSTALLSALPVSAVQACQTLLKLPFVKSSKKVENINPLHRSKVRRNVIFDQKQLEQLEGNSSAFGVSSTFGMRDAYAILWRTKDKYLVNVMCQCIRCLRRILFVQRVKMRRFAQQMFQSF